MSISGKIDAAVQHLVDRLVAGLATWLNATLASLLARIDTHGAAARVALVAQADRVEARLVEFGRQQAACLAENARLIEARLDARLTAHEDAVDRRLVSIERLLIGLPPLADPAHPPRPRAHVFTSERRQ